MFSKIAMIFFRSKAKAEHVAKHAHGQDICIWILNVMAEVKALLRFKEFACQLMLCEVLHLKKNQVSFESLAKMILTAETARESREKHIFLNDETNLHATFTQFVE
jgi:hypothetical protein